MKSIILNKGTDKETEIKNLQVKYSKLFEFQNTYPNAKDLIEVVSKKKAISLESIIQVIYVAYLSSTTEEVPLSYLDFIDSLDFDYKRDLLLFNELTGKNQTEKN